MSRAALSLICVVAFAGAVAGQTEAEAKPLITTDLIFGTYDLVYDMYATAWAKANVDGMLSKLPLDDVKKAASQQMAQVPPEVTQAIAEAQTKSVQLKALATEYLEKAYGPANEMAVAAIAKLETQVPALKGMIPKTLGNLVLFTCYISLVLYTLLKVFLFALAVLRSIFCCLCCCSLCRRRGGSTAAKNSKATNGKATNGKATNGSTKGAADGKAKAKAKK